jgi:hypothetical protein
MQEKQMPPSQPSGFAVQSPIFPGEYSQFSPSFAHTLAGFWGEPSLDVLAGVHATIHNARIASPAVLFIGQAYTLRLGGNGPV